jgi:hypothetical protein
MLYIPVTICLTYVVFGVNEKFFAAPYTYEDNLCIILLLEYK